MEGDGWELQSRLAEVLTRKRKTSQALKAFGIMDPKTALTIFKGGKKALIGGEIGIWENLVRKHPDYSRLLMQLENAYSKHGSLDVAIDGWKQLVETHPDRPESKSNGIIYGGPLQRVGIHPLTKCADDRRKAHLGQGRSRVLCGPECGLRFPWKSALQGRWLR